MTKPTNSKEIEDKGADKSEKPATAKDFVTEFAPSDSEESDAEAVDKADEDYEPPIKKEKEAKEPKDKDTKDTKKYLPKYKKEWENKPELKAWLSESIHGNTYFYCKFCKKDYRCGISDIHKHMSSKKHSLGATMPGFKALKFKFRGLLCPVFTPFLNAKRLAPDVNLKLIPKYAKFLAACNIKGILINDIIGEGMSLTIRERNSLTDAWADSCEKTNQFLMVQIGGAPLKDIIEMAKHANSREVGAIVLLPDLYNRPKTHLDLLKYIKVISEFTKNTPLLYHHHPKHTLVDIDITSFLLDITGEIDSFVGVIYSSGDIHLATTAMNVNREKFTVFMGTDEGILGAAASGFTCIMSPTLNFLPKVVQSICESVRGGDVKAAQTSQFLLNRVVEAFTKEGDYVATCKAATDIITNTCGPTTREPVPTLWEGTIKKIQTKLRELNVM